MEKDETKRTEIENNIIAIASEVQIRERSDNGIYVHLDRLDDFVEACQNLVDYFREYADTTIGVEVVGVYADFTRYFRGLISDTEDSETKQDAQLWLDELEGWMDDIITEAARNWQNLNSGD
jgi:hypothetical protein